VAAESNASPGIYAGDYLGVFPDGGGEHTWSGTCPTMRDNGDGFGRTTVNFLRFGRLMNDPDGS
jgi:hypothetical protein